MKKYICLSLSILWVMFIFGNSLMNAEVSSAQSGFVVEVCQEAAVAVGISPDLITDELVRKSAHFFSFAVLGVLIMLTFKAWFDTEPGSGALRDWFRPHVFTVLFVGLAVGVTDEYIQSFVYGRGSMVQDVVLDFAGYVFGIGVFIGIRAIIRRVRRADS